MWPVVADAASKYIFPTEVNQSTFNSYAPDLQLKIGARRAPYKFSRSIRIERNLARLNST